MEKVIIHRSLPDDGKQTIGKLTYVYLPGMMFSCDTLERAWKNNEVGVSCIPGGGTTYKCRKVTATKNIPYDHYEIMNVKGRTGVMGHKGNFYTDSHACILHGKGYSDINKDGEMDVLNSSKTFKELMAVLPKEFELIIY